MQLDQFSYLRVDAVSDECSNVLPNALASVVSRSARHPILDLPPELISLIFVHCLPSFAELHPSKAPLLLAHICGAWRALALRTPELWASVTFNLFLDSSAANPDKHTKRLALRLRQLAWWLAQGAAHPLTLSLHCRQQHPDTVALLVEHAARWVDADLFLHPTTLAAFSFEAESREFELPLLHRLSLGCSPLRARTTDAEGASPRITAFANAPRLTDVSLIKLSPSAVVLPWAQLTDFYASCADVDDLARVLRLAPTLQRLQLDFQNPPIGGADPEDSDLDPSVTHESLTSLILHTHPALAVPLSVLLGSGLLPLPSLSSLTLPALGPADVSAFVAFAARSRLSHTLQHLTLPLAPLPRGAILDVLAPLQKLEKLELRFPDEAVIDDILGALARTEHRQDVIVGRDSDADAGTMSDTAPLLAPFLPHLLELHVDCFRGTVPYALLRAALEARWRVGTPLQLESLSDSDSEPRPNAASSNSATDPESPHQGLAGAGAAVAVAQLRSFTLTTLAPAPKPMHPLPLSSFSQPDPEATLGLGVGVELDTDVAHLVALQGLKEQGMIVSVAYVYGGRAV